MKNLIDPAISQYRRVHPHLGESARPAEEGFFIVPVGGASLRIIASRASTVEGADWDHVSVSLATRCPTWGEMCVVKDLFFEPKDWCVQYHPAEADYVNCHPYCLHIWRPTVAALPTPPSWLVGPKTVAA